MKLRLKGVYQFRAGFSSLWFNVATPGWHAGAMETMCAAGRVLGTTLFSMWNSMSDIIFGFVCILGELATSSRPRGMMAISTTYKHPKGKMYDKKMHFFKKNRGGFARRVMPMRKGRIKFRVVPSSRSATPRQALGGCWRVSAPPCGGADGRRVIWRFCGRGRLWRGYRAWRGYRPSRCRHR